MYVCIHYIVLGGVAYYNSGWGYYSNNHYLFNALLIYNYIVLEGVAYYSSEWGYYNNNHHLFNALLIYNTIVWLVIIVGGAIIVLIRASCQKVL